MMSTITLAPLPSLRELVLAVICPALADEMLAKPWLGRNDHAIWFSRSAWSLNAIAKLRTRLNCEKTVTVWVPDFFCNTSLAPLREAGVKLVFYRITNELTPDLDWCRSQSNGMHPDLFILVHYFGQPTSANQVAQFCKDAGAWLIEDAAHVLQPISGVGDHGDFVIYSPHKHLAIPDGAILLIRKSGPTQFGDNENVFTVFKEVTDATPHQFRASFKYLITWLIKRGLQKTGIRKKNPQEPLWPDSIPKNSFPPSPAMSGLAKRLLSVQIHSLNDVADMRRQHLMDWHKGLLADNMINGKIGYWPMQATPYLACIAGDDFQITEKFYNSLQSKNLPVLNWPDLPPEVLSEPDQHENAISLRKRRIYLPIHQTLQSLQIKKLINDFSNSKEN